MMMIWESHNFHGWKKNNASSEGLLIGHGNIECYLTTLDQSLPFYSAALTCTDLDM